MLSGMRNKEIPTSAWFIPVIPIALATAIYFGEVQSSSFLFINRLTQLLPDTVWVWLTFFGNGWGVFAMAFPLVLLAPRLLTAGIFAGSFAAIASFSLKNFFDLPRPAGILLDGSFYRIGEPLLNRALPSGHTLTAFAIASALYFSVDQGKRRPMLLIFVFASLIGLSRNAVGAHWLTDVLAGAGVGMWCGLLGAMLGQHISDSRLSPTSLWPRVIAIAGALSIYVHLTQIMDHELNLPLQYASIAIIALTLILFIKAQFIKTK
jgi:membrane-associated phospholipid phosphatase